MREDACTDGVSELIAHGIPDSSANGVSYVDADDGSDSCAYEGTYEGTYSSAYKSAHKSPYSSTITCTDARTDAWSSLLEINALLRQAARDVHAV